MHHSINAPHSLDNAVTTGVRHRHQKTDSLVRPDPRSSVCDRLAVQELEPLLALGDDQGWFRGDGGKCCFRSILLQKSDLMWR
jgi:hypothetical protein